ncbi:hypothetical protein SteCoe_25950 [Stentor coeruleus]|uniref:Dynein heavy chain coiled coil stalk domain-containing protein n=1 Tax=Stentor coeruleus TaxID=5963 RepID=A0A1R2BDZ6_9CILI|nr:hypothetical protein SteCoe_25950 [Stentor coeruleus]
MNADNIVLMIFLWDYGYVGKQGTDVFKVILDSARELILSLHAKSFEIKKEVDRKVIASKFFSFDNIPEAKKGVGKPYSRPGHFMSEQPMNFRESYSEEPQVSESELYNAVNQVETSLRALTQSDIIELRASSSNPLVLKVLQMVCILKGYNASTWNNIKEMLDSRTFKIELGMIDVFKISKRQSQIIRNLLKENPKLTTESLSRVSLPAATLLSWIQGILTWHAGKNIVRAAPLENPEMRKSSQVVNASWGNQIIPRSPQQIDEEVEDELITVKKLKGSPELEDKLRKTRELKVEYEERIERILKTRLDEVNFEGDKIDLTDEDIINYLSSQSLQQHPTSVLLALVDKLKDRRLAESS